MMGILKGWNSIANNVCRYGRLNIATQILKLEQNNSVINEGDGRGLTPLHIASLEGMLCSYS